jgi:hypothetical protein
MLGLGWLWDRLYQMLSHACGSHATCLPRLLHAAHQAAAPRATQPDYRRAHRLRGLAVSVRHYARYPRQQGLPFRAHSRVACCFLDTLLCEGAAQTAPAAGVLRVTPVTAGVRVKSFVSEVRGWPASQPLAAPASHELKHPAPYSPSLPQCTWSPSGSSGASAKRQTCGGVGASLWCPWHPVRLQLPKQ